MFLEVQAGFEPADNGVADRGLTTWLLHQIFDCLNIIAELFGFVKGFFTLFSAFAEEKYAFSPFALVKCFVLCYNICEQRKFCAFYEKGGGYGLY